MNKSLPDRPVPDSYWVIPRRLVAGAYPGSRYFESEADRRLGSLLQAGVNFFLDLTQPGELPPYLEQLQTQAGWLERHVEYRRIPVEDMSYPTPQKMVEILDVLDAAMREGKVVYVHCWGGVGRTGTVVGCYLARHGMQGAEALNAISRLRAGIANGWLRSPETDEQCALVLNWKAGE